MDTRATLSINSHIKRATACLAGMDSARLDAELLLAHATGHDRAWLYAHPQTALSMEEEQKFEKLIRQRQTCLPLAYLTGTREFWSMDLKVTQHTLIPRPETEHLVEQALQLIDEGATWRVADLGAGSGAVGLAIARERPRCKILATDRSARALQVAAENSRIHQLTNLQFVVADWLAGIKQKFDLIASNPPYIKSGDPHLLSGGVQYEPELALAAGPDGLACLRQITTIAPEHLHNKGWLLLEHGHDQGSYVRDLFLQAGFTRIDTRSDLAGHERITAGQWQHA